MRTQCAILLALTLVGCSGKPNVTEDRLKRLPRPVVAEGWQVVKAKGANFSIALPKNWTAVDLDFGALMDSSKLTPAPNVNFSPTSLLAARPKPKNTNVPSVGLIATGPIDGSSFGTVIVTAEGRSGRETAMDVANREMRAFEDNMFLRAENAKVKEYALPIGPACRAQYTLKMLDLEMVTKSYYLIDGDVVYNVTFMQTGGPQMPTMPTKEIMGTFRVAKDP